MSQNSPKPKILYVITQGEMGGAQRYVFDLATNLDPERYEIAVAIGKENSDLKDSLDGRGIQTMELKFLKRNISPAADLAAIFELKGLIQKFQPDIVHLNSSKAGVIGSLAAKLAGHHHVVFTAHGFAFLEPHLFRFLYFWAEKFASIFRSKIITVSEYDRLQAIAYKLSKPEKLITIHNGIKLGKSENRKIGSVRVPTSDLRPLVIGTIARDYPTKDLKTLRAAFDLMKEEYPRSELKILSGVSDAAHLLSEFDIYVCSSVKEGFPYTILEAMAAGLPIVSTSVGGIPEAITDGKEGLLVPPRNPVLLAKAINELIANPDLAREFGQGAQQKVQEFSLDKMIAETMGVYQKLL